MSQNSGFNGESLRQQIRRRLIEQDSRCQPQIYTHLHMHVYLFVWACTRSHTYTHTHTHHTTHMNMKKKNWKKGGSNGWRYRTTMSNLQDDQGTPRFYSHFACLWAPVRPGKSLRKSREVRSAQYQGQEWTFKYIRDRVEPMTPIPFCAVEWDVPSWIITSTSSPQ